MSETPPFPPHSDDDEKKAQEQAKARYGALNLIRVGGIAVTIAGLAGAREVIPLPYALSVILALAGIAAFFFGPTWLVRRWKERDREG